MQLICGKETCVSISTPSSEEIKVQSKGQKLQRITVVCLIKNDKWRKASMIYHSQNIF